jgi:hypothetical protein
MAASAPRFVGLEVEKPSLVVSAVDAQQQVLLPARRVAVAEFESWVTTHWLASAAVVLEASTTAWQFYDLLDPLVASVTVAHPFLIKLIAPVACQNGWTGLPAPGEALSGEPDPCRVGATQAGAAAARDPGPPPSHNQGSAQGHATGFKAGCIGTISHPQRVIPSTFEQRAWWTSLPFSALEHLQVRQDLALLEHLAPLIKELEATLAHLWRDDPWAKPMARLLPLPGVGLVTALLREGLSRRDDPLSFRQAIGGRKPAWAAASRRQDNPIARVAKPAQGRRDLRAVLEDRRLHGRRTSPAQDQHAVLRLAARTGKKQAILAIARKLLGVMWQVLTRKAGGSLGRSGGGGAQVHARGVRSIARRPTGASLGHSLQGDQLTAVGLGADLETLVDSGHRYTRPSGAGGSGEAGKARQQKGEARHSFPVTGKEQEGMGSLQETFPALLTIPLIGQWDGSSRARLINPLARTIFPGACVQGGHREQEDGEQKIHNCSLVAFLLVFLYLVAWEKAAVLN